MAYFRIKTKSSGFSFELIADNGEIMLMSETFIQKSACRNAIVQVKNMALLDESYESKTTSNGKFYFVLKCFNGSILARSALYESQTGRDYGIVVLKRIATKASFKGDI